MRPPVAEGIWAAKKKKEKSEGGGGHCVPEAVGAHHDAAPRGRRNLGSKKKQKITFFLLSWGGEGRGTEAEVRGLRLVYRQQVSKNTR